MIDPHGGSPTSIFGLLLGGDCLTACPSDQSAASALSWSLWKMVRFIGAAFLPKNPDIIHRTVHQHKTVNPRDSGIEEFDIANALVCPAFGKRTFQGTRLNKESLRSYTDQVRIVATFFRYIASDYANDFGVEYLCVTVMGAFCHWRARY